MTTWVWWWQQYAQGAIDAYAARVGAGQRRAADAADSGQGGGHVDGQ